jgi:hypothetical protein
MRTATSPTTSTNLKKRHSHVTCTTARRNAMAKTSRQRNPTNPPPAGSEVPVVPSVRGGVGEHSLLLLIPPLLLHLSHSLIGKGDREQQSDTKSSSKPETPQEGSGYRRTLRRRHPLHLERRIQQSHRRYQGRSCWRSRGALLCRSRSSSLQKSGQQRQPESRQ